MEGNPPTPPPAAVPPDDVTPVTKVLRVAGDTPYVNEYRSILKDKKHGAGVTTMKELLSLDKEDYRDVGIPLGPTRTIMKNVAKMANVTPVAVGTAAMTDTPTTTMTHTVAAGSTSAPTTVAATAASAPTVVAKTFAFYQQRIAARKSMNNTTLEKMVESTAFYDNNLATEGKDFQTSDPNEIVSHFLDWCLENEELEPATKRTRLQSVKAVLERQGREMSADALATLTSAIEVYRNEEIKQRM